MSDTRYFRSPYIDFNWYITLSWFKIFPNVPNMDMQLFCWILILIFQFNFIRCGPPQKQYVFGFRFCGQDIRKPCVQGVSRSQKYIYLRSQFFLFVTFRNFAIPASNIQYQGDALINKLNVPFVNPPHNSAGIFLHSMTAKGGVNNLASRCCRAFEGLWIYAENRAYPLTTIKTSGMLATKKSLPHWAFHGFQYNILYQILHACKIRKGRIPNN